MPCIMWGTRCKGSYLDRLLHADLHAHAADGAAAAGGRAGVQAGHALPALQAALGGPGRRAPYPCSTPSLQATSLFAIHIVLACICISTAGHVILHARSEDNPGPPRGGMPLQADPWGHVWGIQGATPRAAAAQAASARRRRGRAGRPSWRASPSTRACSRWATSSAPWRRAPRGRTSPTATPSSRASCRCLQFFAAPLLCSAQKAMGRLRMCPRAWRRPDWANAMHAACVQWQCYVHRLFACCSK